MTAISSIVFPGSITPSQPWGDTTLTVEPLLNGRHFHCGIDLPMVIGTPLKAARAGRVGYCGPALVAVETGSQTDWYIHDDHAAPGIAVGVHVNRGQLLCYSGNKVPAGGATTGPHTHVEVQNSPIALVRRFIIGPFGIRIPLAIRPGEMNNPATSVDPVPVLTAGRFASAGGAITATTHQGEDDMNFSKDSEGRVFAVDQGWRPDGKWGTVKDLLTTDEWAAYQDGGATVGQSRKVASNGVTDDLIDSRIPYRGAPPATPASGPASAVDLTAILNAITDLKQHPAVVSDPELKQKLDALSKHVGVGTA